MNADQASADLASVDLVKNIALESELEEWKSQLKLSKESVKGLLEECGKDRSSRDKLITLLYLLTSLLKNIDDTVQKIRQLIPFGMVPNQELLQLFATTHLPAKIIQSVLTGIATVDLSSLLPRFLEVDIQLDAMEDYLGVVLRLVQGV